MSQSKCLDFSRNVDVFRIGYNIFGQPTERRLYADILVIDEMSMTDAHILSLLLERVVEGARLVFVGDVDQLPSVGPGRVFLDIIDAGVFNVTRLTQLFRQGEHSQIALNAHAVNRGELYGESLDIHFNNETDAFWIDVQAVEQAPRAFWQKMLTRLMDHHHYNAQEIQVLTPQYRGTWGVWEVNRHLQALLNPPVPAKQEFRMDAETIFREGDRVMNLENDKELDVANGEVGYIEEIVTNANQDIWMTVRFSPDKQVEFEGDKVECLQLAYAMSIHKSQGNEYPIVIMPVTPEHARSLNRSMLYTGLTRAKRMHITVGDQQTWNQATRRDDAHQRYTGLRERLQERWHLSKADMSLHN